MKRQPCPLCPALRGLVLLLGGGVGWLAGIELGWAQDGALTQFTIGSEKISKQRRAILSIPGAEALEVHLSGSIDPKQDVLRIYPYQNGRTGHLALEEKGDFSRHQPLIINNDAVVVTFNSNGQTTRAGLHVQIASLSPLTLLERIRNDLDNSLKKIATRGAGFAAQELAKNEAVFQTLQQALDKRQQDEAGTWRAVSDALRQLAGSYAQIAAQKDAVLKDNQLEIAKISALTAEMHTQAERAQQRKIDEEQALVALNQVPLTAADEISRARHAITLNAKTSLVKSLVIQVQVWETLAQTQAELPDKLISYNQRLGLLYYTLEVNARLYQEAANIVQHDPGFVRETLGGLTGLADVLRQVAEDWQAVQNLRQQLHESRF